MREKLAVVSIENCYFKFMVKVDGAVDQGDEQGGRDGRPGGVPAAAQAGGGPPLGRGSRRSCPSGCRTAANESRRSR